MGRNISLQQLVFLQQVVDRGQIFAIILRGKKSFHLRNKQTRQTLRSSSVQFLHVDQDRGFSPQTARSQSP